MAPAAAEAHFHAPVREWFAATFGAATPVQRAGWPPILAGQSALLLAPTGSGKTLAAFLAGLDRLMFEPITVGTLTGFPRPPAMGPAGQSPSDAHAPIAGPGVRLLYVSPLKALAVDVERNLRTPLAGVAAVAARRGVPCRAPVVAIRTGDTPPTERARQRRRPPDVLITTPESLYLILTSQAAATLRTVATVIVDEVHAMLPTKRGAHLALSLERLEALRPPGAPPLQRIGLSATQRPPAEAARLLGGMDAAGAPRPVVIVDARQPKKLELRVELPGHPELPPDGAGAEARPAASAWSAIHARLLELIRAHRTTMIFVNSRRLAERLAAALNELAGAEVAQAHHGSVAREQRGAIEERLKAGQLPAIVATSSLELGIDMGAVDLCVQVEAPLSVTSGLQRIGRAGHQVDAPSRGVLLPKFRGDLLASAAAARLMREQAVEETAYPRSPLDVLAQQLVAIASGGPQTVDGLYALCRGAAPFAELPRATFEAVLDLLAGRYPSDEIAALKPRLVWDRRHGIVRAREGARRVAVGNAGTIPDRGLYGVFLPDAAGGRGVRVGELDEEMVFESRVGDVFVLGASSWRITDITRDRVLVQPAPAELGRMPFWHGDRPGRPAAFGRAVGRLAREVAHATDGDARRRLEEDALDPAAAASLLAYVRAQQEATGEVPSDRTAVLERYQDEMGDWRVCLLTPFGRRVHAPWALAVQARAQARSGAQPEAIVGDDGIVFRFPEADVPPPRDLFFPTYEEADELVRTHLPGTALFAAHFREVAARALLLPRRQVGRRAPLWQQRKRAADLLAVAARFPSFPMILEAMRECLHDVFDLPALREILGAVAAGGVRVAVATTRTPSPFAAALLFSYVGNFMYDEDAPLAERRARALAVDLGALRTLLGEAELRDLLDPAVLVEHERRLQALGSPAAAAGAAPAASAPAPRAATADDVHDLVLRLGDLGREEIRDRLGDAAAAHLRGLVAEERVVPLRVGGAARFVAVEDAARYRDAVGVALPAGLPAAFLEPVAAPLADLVARFARTHGPFCATDVAARLGVGAAPVLEALDELRARGRLTEGELRPGVSEREFCDIEVLRALKAQSLWRLRQAAAPVAPHVLQQLLLEWHGVLDPARGPDAVLQAVALLEGAAMPASILEREVLPARVAAYRPGDLDALLSAGEVVWMGVEPLGDDDGRLALYRREALPTLGPPPREPPDEEAARVLEALRARGASFFADLKAAQGGFAGDLNAALWALVWAGLVTNDTLLPLRARLAAGAAPPRAHARFLRHPAVLAHRSGPPGTEGRWSLVPPATATGTAHTLAVVESLVRRHGVLTREAVRAEGLPGGFAAIYPVLKALEEAGRLRRGYFVEHLGATQFALPGADEQLRAARSVPSPASPAGARGAPAGPVVTLAAADPANAYGAALPWPTHALSHLLGRAAGAQVLLEGGHLRAFLTRTGHDLLLFTPGAGTDPALAIEAVAAALASLVDEGPRPHLLIARIDGEPAQSSRHLGPFRAAGFSPSSRGLLFRRRVAR